MKIVKKGKMEILELKIVITGISTSLGYLALY